MERRRIRRLRTSSLAAVAGLDPRLESLIVGVGLWLTWIIRRLGAASAHSSAGGRGPRSLPACAPHRRLCFLVMLAEGAITELERYLLRHDAERAQYGRLGVHGILAWDGPRATRRRRHQRPDRRRQVLRVGTALVAIALGGVLIVGERGSRRTRLRRLQASVSQTRCRCFQRRRTYRSARAVPCGGVHPRLHRLHRRPAHYRLHLRPGWALADARTADGCSGDGHRAGGRAVGHSDNRADVDVVGEIVA